MAAPATARRIGADLVRKEGLEPTCLAALEPKSSASTNSATFAVAELYPKSARRQSTQPPARHADIIRENSNASSPLVGRSLRELPGRLAAAAGARCARPSRRSTASRAAPTTSPTRATLPDAERLAGLERVPARARRDRARPHARTPLFARIADVIREHAPAARSCFATCSTLSAGRRQEALRRLRRSARLLPALGQSGRAAAAAPVRANDRASKPRAVRRHLLGAAAHQLLAGRRDRLGKRTASTCRRTTWRASASTEKQIAARRVRRARGAS